MSTSVPGAVEAWLAMATAALPQGTTIVFADVIPTFTAPLTLQLTGVKGDQTSAEIGPSYRREEHYTISCELTSYAGDQDMLARLSEVFTAFESLLVAVGSQPNLPLAGVPQVRFAQITDFSFSAEPDQAGQSIGTISFDVDVQARVESLS